MSVLGKFMKESIPKHHYQISVRIDRDHFWSDSLSPRMSGLLPQYSCYWSNWRPSLLDHNWED